MAPGLLIHGLFVSNHLARTSSRSIRLTLPHRFSAGFSAYLAWRAIRNSPNTIDTVLYQLELFYCLFRTTKIIEVNDDPG